MLRHRTMADFRIPALILICLAIPTAPAPPSLRHGGECFLQALPTAQSSSLALSRMPCPNPMLPLLVGLRGGGDLSGDEQVEGSEMDEMRGEKPGTGGAEDEARAWQPWAMTDRDPPRRKARWDDEGEGDNAVVRGKLNTTSLAAMKLADARRGQEVLVEEEAWTGHVDAKSGVKIQGIPTAKGADPKMQGKWLVEEGGGGGMRLIDMTLDAPLSEGREERSEEFMRNVVLLEVLGGSWAVENCSVSCRHGVCVRCGSDSKVDFALCSMGGIYDMHYWREQYQFRINEVQVCMNADDVEVEMGKLEEDVIVSGGAVAALWARGNSSVRINNTWLQYACMPPHKVIRNDLDLSLKHKAPEWEDDDARMTAYFEKLALVALSHNSSTKKIPVDKIPLPPRPLKGRPFDCSTAVLLQGVARCTVSCCTFKRNNVGVSVDDKSHVLVENCTVLSGNYGFLDAVEWGVPRPRMEPSDMGATVELAGNRVRGRLWASGNMPRVTRVLRRNVVEPVSERPNFERDLEFEEGRIERQNEVAALDAEIKECQGMHTPSDYGDTDEGGGDYATWPVEKVIGGPEGGLNIDWGDDIIVPDKEEKEFTSEEVQDYRKPIDLENIHVDVFPGVLASMGFNNSVIDMFYDEQDPGRGSEDVKERELKDGEAEGRLARGEIQGSEEAKKLGNYELETDATSEDSWLDDSG